MSPATSGWVFTLPGGVRLGPLWGHTVAFETENNATLWPWLQIKEKLGPIARQERLSLNINTRRVCPLPTPSPLPPLWQLRRMRSHWLLMGGQRPVHRALLLSAASVIFNLPLAKGLKPRKTKQTWVGHQSRAIQGNQSWRESFQPFTPPCPPNTPSSHNGSKG